MKNEAEGFYRRFVQQLKMKLKATKYWKYTCPVSIPLYFIRRVTSTTSVKAIRSAIKMCLKCRAIDPAQLPWQKRKK